MMLDALALHASSLSDVASVRRLIPLSRVRYIFDVADEGTGDVISGDGAPVLAKPFTAETPSMSSTRSRRGTGFRVLYGLASEVGESPRFAMDDWGDGWNVLVATGDGMYMEGWRRLGSRRGSAERGISIALRRGGDLTLSRTGGAGSSCGCCRLLWLDERPSQRADGYGLLSRGREIAVRDLRQRAVRKQTNVTMVRMRTVTAMMMPPATTAACLFPWLCELEERACGEVDGVVSDVLDVVVGSVMSLGSRLDHDSVGVELGSTGCVVSHAPIKKGIDCVSKASPVATKTYHPGSKSTGSQVKLSSAASTTPPGTGSKSVVSGCRLGVLVVEMKNETSSSGPEYVHLIVLDAQVLKGEKGEKMKEASSNGAADADAAGGRRDAMVGDARME